MKGLFQCPSWAKSFCPFRACCLQELRQQLLNSLTKITPLTPSSSMAFVLTPSTPEQKQLLNKDKNVIRL